MTKFVTSFRNAHPELVFHGGEYLRALPSGRWQSVHATDVAALFLAANPELANTPDVQLALNNQLCQLRSLIYRESIPTEKESGLQGFVRDCLIVGPNLECSPDEVVAAYHHWSGEVTSAKSLGVHLREVLDIELARRGSGTNRYYVWKGVDVKDD